MKRILLATCIAGILFGCSDEAKVKPRPLQNPHNKEVREVKSIGQYPFNSKLNEMVIVEVDGCEYIAYNNQPLTSAHLTHKGNCKFCMKKQEELIRRILLEKIH